MGNASSNSNSNANSNANAQRPMSNSNMYMGVPTSIHHRRGYTDSDPLNNYQHVCTKCQNTTVDMPRPPLPMPVNQNLSGPFPYDTHQALSKYQNVCNVGKNSMTYCKLI